jgi:putative hydrolase of the HAD superfamily
MDIRAVAFDVNGTLVRILADDDEERIYRAAAHFLTYQGIDLHRHELRDVYFQIMKEHLRASPEKYPEFDAVDIWRSIIEDYGTDFTRALPTGKLQQMPLFLAEMSRGISRRQLGLYPYVCEVLDVLREHYRLGIVTDAQSVYARGELHKVGLLGYFDPIVVSGDHGYRKPDRRLFQYALDGMGVAAGNSLYVGNDMHRDIYGAREAGLTTVMFDSDQGSSACPCPDRRTCASRSCLSASQAPFVNGQPDHSLSEGNAEVMGVLSCAQVSVACRRSVPRSKPGWPGVTVPKCALFRLLPVKSAPRRSAFSRRAPQRFASRRSAFFKLDRRRSVRDRLRPQHRYLLAQHQQLGILPRRRTRHQHYPPGQVEADQVEHPQAHKPAMLPANQPPPQANPQVTPYAPAFSGLQDAEGLRRKGSEPFSS